MLDSRLFWKLLLVILGIVLMAVVLTAALAYEWRGEAEMGKQLFALGVVVMLLSGGLIALVVRSLVGPLLTLGRAARAIAEGDYGHRVPVRSSDELGDLARSFNQVGQELGAHLTQLRDSDDRQAAVLGGMVEGVVAVDDSHRIMFANTAAGKMFGFLPPSAVGRPLLEIIREHTLDAAVSKVLSTRQPQAIELHWQIEAPRVLAVQVTPLPGSVDVGAVIVLHDNTELRRLETIRQEFIANVSHELKTPLSSIMAYTETLQRGALDDPEHREQFLSRIAEQGERLHNLIQDMLSLARIETAQQPFDIKPVDVSEVVRRCLDDYAPQAMAKSIALETVGELPAARVRADEEGLRVICNNLIDNAVKYTPEGGRVSVGWHREDRYVRIEVSDSGPGIPRSEVGRVFERFYRVDKARSRELGSTGLGLSIVKHLAQSFGGKVGVESQVGQGSRFWVQLPAA